MEKTIKLEQSYLNLPNELHTVMDPYHNYVSSIALLNKDLIKELDFESTFLESKEGLLFLSGSTDKYGPLFSQAYSGHQYGYFTTLGDGRAVILGEYIHQNKLYDIQLKGTGRTPYSRRGDGKATLYSMLREYLISEAMHHLNIPTTRALAVLNTNEVVNRATTEKGGILCRVASSHIRVGTLQYAQTNTSQNTVKALVDYSIDRHYPEITDKNDKYQLFLRIVIKNQAQLISKWQSVGFVHGVMNTDNMTISGETIDYGPCAFLDTYDPSMSFSSIDQNNRYSYQNQPAIGSWNLARFAESILPLLHVDIDQAMEIANNELKEYKNYYESSNYDLFAKKLGINGPTDEDKVIVDELLLIMQKYKADFTNTFRLLTLDQYQKLPFYNTNDFKLWFQKWTRQLGYRKQDSKARIKLMEQHNPVIIPRNQLVEQALLDASRENDYTLFNELLSKLKDPFNYQVTHETKYSEPLNKEEHFVTYCGT